MTGVFLITLLISKGYNISACILYYRPIYGRKSWPLIIAALINAMFIKKQLKRLNNYTHTHGVRNMKKNVVGVDDV